MTPASPKIPLVLLHGWGVNSMIWKPLVDRLNESFGVTCVDLPGYGRDADYTGDYSMVSVVERVLEFAPPRAIWVAWSLGATVAMRAALHSPERFIKLQLVSPTPRFSVANDWKLGATDSVVRSMGDRMAADYERGLKKFLLLQTQNRRVVRDCWKSILGVAPPTPTTLERSLNLLTESDLRDDVGQINIATQVVAGEEDRVIPASASRWLSEQIEGSGFVLMDDLQTSGSSSSGHLCFLEHEDSFVRNLRSFSGRAAE